MAGQTYTQCTYIQKKPGGAFLVDTAWIPTKFAKKGKLIRIDGKQGVWEVIGVGNTKGEKEALEDSRDYLKQREASDIKRAPRKLREHMDY